MPSRILLTDYPVLPSTLNSFVQKIVSSVKARQPHTFNFDPKMGGARAWIKFILNNPTHTKLNSLLNGKKLVVFEPDECVESSNLAFFYLLLESISDKHLKRYEDYSLKEVIGEIQKNIRDPKNDLVVFLVKLDSFKDFSPTTGNLLYSIWKDNKDKITFIITLSKGLSEKEIDETAGAFNECLLTSYEKIERLDNKDITQSVLHWSTKLGYDFTDSEIKAIVKHSQGKALISKILCQELSKAGHIKNPDLFCRSNSEILHIAKGGSQLSLKDDHNSIYLKDKNISPLLSYQEFSTLRALLEKQSSIVNRDDLADALWGESAYEKYSDWAIDKFISLVRLKLKKLNFSGEIKAKKGEGFILIQ